MPVSYINNFIINTFKNQRYTTCFSLQESLIWYLLLHRVVNLFYRPGWFPQAYRFGFGSAKVFATKSPGIFYPNRIKGDGLCLRFLFLWRDRYGSAKIKIFILDQELVMVQDCQFCYLFGAIVGKQDRPSKYHFLKYISKFFLFAGRLKGALVPDKGYCAVGLCLQSERP